MSKIAVTEFMSIDGVIQDPHEWHFSFTDEGTGMYKHNELVQTSSLLLGRTTYEGFAAAWPVRGRDMAGKPEPMPEDSDGETYFSDRFNWLPKYVVSDSLAEGDATWNNTHILRGEGLVDALHGLKEQLGGDIVIHGSGKLINSLMHAGVIDEYRLMVHPIVVGKGQRLFPDGLDSLTLDLVDTTVYEKGIVVLTYAPAK
ncbi:MAG TPA: dihydrofolate reductase family protein [Thermomicrobiales bacterium]|nr:dihydrofolate reductase family protein [Thermomicrobiales bacterium]